ncbi:NUDIX domain-containing protein [Streptomyces vinaceus]|uniref:NUDIX domain-containing protein n=1 Tax=Streptomyces vinaceus TaxID=1960 RepID=UPI0036B64059
MNNAGDVLLERRSDNGRWGMPGGVQEVGENIAGTVVREVLEETGIHVEVADLVGIFTDPGHIIAFADERCVRSSHSASGLGRSAGRSG